jgi:BTB/POZ domain
MDAADLQTTIQALKQQIDKLTVDAEQASKRQKDLECRVKELEDRTAVSVEPEFSLPNERTTEGQWEPRGTDVVHLNVGGSTKISVLRSTLACMEGSMLATRFSGRWDDTLQKDREDNFFIDQPAELFVPMIEFLQCKVRESLQPAAYPLLSPEDFGGSFNQFRKFADLVEYYGMTPVVLPPVIHYFGAHEDDVLVSGHRVDAKKQVTCELVPRPWDKRRIRSFEITVGTITSLQVGWAVHQAKTTKGEYRSDFSRSRAPFTVGRTYRSVGYDCVTNTLSHSPDFCFLKTGLSVQPGDVIRCERKGRDFSWSIGEQTLTHHGATDLAESDPTFSGLGTWWVTSIEF